jgi:hypothetical protein|tara:strand:+ start:383 stop:604 length:222 start_codon:yes stop_codon:yes gene_type:complete
MKKVVKSLKYGLFGLATALLLSSCQTIQSRNLENKVNYTASTINPPATAKVKRTYNPDAEYVVVHIKPYLRRS